MAAVWCRAIDTDNLFSCWQPSRNHFAALKAAKICFSVTTTCASVCYRWQVTPPPHRSMKELTVRAYTQQSAKSRAVNVQYCRRPNWTLGKVADPCRCSVISLDFFVFIQSNSFPHLKLVIIAIYALCMGTQKRDRCIVEMSSYIWRLFIYIYECSAA